MDLIDIYKTFHSKVAEYTFFSSVHVTPSRINHVLGHKISPRKFKKTKIISSIFSNYNAILEINYDQKLNNMLLNNQ